MTHLIEPWSNTDSVKVLQTTHRLNKQPFDIHPKQNNGHQIEQLKLIYQLPHTPKFMLQVHGSAVVEYRHPPESNLTIHADACFTRQPNTICTVMTADCLPVLLTDEKGSFVAAIHCGWRSLFDDILIKTIETINPSGMVQAWFGPCIQQAQYEVDEAFVINYLNKHPHTTDAFSTVIKGKSFADLYQLAEIQLQQAVSCSISKSNECTFSDPRYYSWRKNQTAKRMASMIWLRAT